MFSIAFSDWFCGKNRGLCKGITVLEYTTRDNIVKITDKVDYILQCKKILMGVNFDALP